MEPATMYEPTQLVRMKIMPTDRSMPAVMHDERLRHRHEGEEHALVGGGLHDDWRWNPAGWLVT